VRWSPDGKWLGFLLAPGGGMNQQVYVIRPDGTGLRRLTDGGKETNWMGEWSNGGKMLAVASNRRDPFGMDAYQVDVETGEFVLAAENRGTGYLTDVSADGKLGLLYRLENRSSSDLFLVDLTSGALTHLTPHEGPGNFTDARFSADSRTIYLTSDMNLDKIAFARIRLDDAGKPGAIGVVQSREDAGLDEFNLTKDGKTAVLVWNVAARSELAFVDLATGQMTPGPVVPAEVIGSPTFSPDGSLLAFMATGSNAPRNVWIYDLRSKALTQLTHSPHPGIALGDLVTPELVRFAAHDGLELTGWLYRPHNFQAPGAVVLSFHGGPEGQERPWFNDDYQALLAQGIAVFAPNVRGSGGFGKRFVNLDNGVLRWDAIRDIQACADYVVGAGVGAPGKLGIMGGSYGGYMTMAGLCTYPDLFAAGVNLFGVVNFKTFFAHTEPWMAAISKIEYGDPDTEGEMLDQLSPMTHIDKVIAPTLVLHGANDTNVPVIEAEQVVENLKRRNIPVEYILFPDEGHGFQKEPNRITSAVATVEWFVKYLLSN
jgi:dipeptidyl aminopeptidase/acylaminoacyl peptidase